MATYYWVGGTGTWDSSNTTNWAASSGAGGGAGVPTPADDAVFDNLSNLGTSAFIVNTSGANCSNLIFSSGASQIDGTMTFNLSGVLALNVYGNLNLPTANIAISTNGIITFRANTPGKRITTNGRILPSLGFNGVGGEWTLQDDITLSSGFNIAHTGGSLNTNNKTIICNNFGSSGSSVRSLTLGSSNIVCQLSSSGTVWGLSGSNLTFNSNTSVITIPGTGTSDTLLFLGGGYTYNNVAVTSSGQVDISMTSFVANTVLIGPRNSAVIGVVDFGAATANGLIVTGANQSARTQISGLTLRSNTTSSVSYVDFLYTTVSSTTLTGTSLGDCGNNSGISFPAAKTVYMRSGTTWGSNVWSSTSTGSVLFSNFPLPQDTAVIDNNSSATSLSLGEYNIGSINISKTSAFTFAMAGSSTSPDIYGSITLGTNTTVTGAFATEFVGSGTQTITSNGRSFSNQFIISKAGGSFSLGDNFRNTSTNSFTLTAGNIDTNGYDFNVSAFNSSVSNFRIVNFGTSRIITDSFSLSPTNLTFNASNTRFYVSSTFNLSTLSSTIGSVYISALRGTNSIIFSLNAINCTITNLINDKNYSNTIEVDSNIGTGGVGGITNLLISGTAEARVYVASGVVGTQRTIVFNGTRANLSFIDFKDIAFSYPFNENNPYRVYAGGDSVNYGNNNRIAYIDGYKNTAYLLTANTSWTVPSNWNNNANRIHLIGAGGGGARSEVSGSNRAAGGGGGGGGYTIINNFITTPGNTITYNVGTSVANTDGGNTTWNSGASMATGGKRGLANTLPSSSGGLGGTGTFTGGSGGAGSFGTTASQGYGSGGGGGAAGPYGNGGNGGNGFAATNTTLLSGGGGGGNGGGGNGENGLSGLGGQGGHNFLGEGGAQRQSNAGGSGSFGGGGSGGAGSISSSGGEGSLGNDIENTIGSSGGNGGSGVNAGNPVNVGLYGAGGPGGGITTTGTISSGGAGGNGAIFIAYTSGDYPPYGGRLTANGVFTTGECEFDEINNSKFGISWTNKKVYANTFDEIVINPSLNNNYYSGVEADRLPFWDAQFNTSEVERTSIVDVFGNIGSAIEIYADIATGIHASQDTIFLISKLATISIFAKAPNVTRYFNLTLDDSTNNGFYGTFDALTGGIIGTGVNIGTIYGATSKYYGNGWWRFSVSGGINPSESFTRFSINILGTATNAWFPSTTMTVGAGNGIYFYGVQVESQPFLSTWGYSDDQPFAVVPMRLETTNELFVRSELDEVNKIT